MNNTEDKKISRRGHNLVGNPGGRPKGSKNRATLARDKLLSCEDVQQKIKDGTFVSPLAFLIDVYMDDNQELSTRIDCAKSCLVYLHKKQPVDTNTNITNNTDQLFEISLVKSNKD